MAIFGRDLIRTAQWFRSGLEQARCVGRLNGSSSGGGNRRAVASGFLFDGALLGERYAGLPLYLTGDFCITGLTPPITIVFEGMFDDASSNVTAEPAMTLAQDAVLHYALLLLQRWPGKVASFILSPVRPETGDRVAVISYPQGGGLAFSVDEDPVSKKTDEMIARDAMHLFHRAGTLGGSSGGLVLNDKWEPVAMHIGRENNANYAVRLPVVIADAQEKLKTTYVADSVLNSIRAAVHEEPPQDTVRYFSAFISYTHADKAFARRLYLALQARGIRAWRDEEQMLPGEDIYDGVQRAIEEQDKVLLCCSRTSLSASGWVDSEIGRALQKERDRTRSNHAKARVVIPIDLDGFLFDWKDGKASDLTSRITADFRGWEDDTKFNASFDKLVQALRAGDD